jgi:hypothetical protein
LSRLKSHVALGGYEVAVKEIALSQQMLREGCPVQVVDECPPLAYSGLVDPELVQELQKVWVRLDEKARGASGELKLRCGSWSNALMGAIW